MRNVTLWIGVILAPSLPYLAVTADSPGFQADIQRVLSRNCASCHNSADPKAELNLEPDHAFASLVGKQSSESPLLRVKPGKAEDSYLFRKITGSHLDAGGQGVAMPPTGTSLPTSQIELIRRWIDQGAAP